MEDRKNYDLWKALLHELLLSLFELKTSLRNNLWLKKISDWTRPDWILWKVEQTMLDVSEQAKKIVEDWEKQEPPKYKVIEHPPDDSDAQRLLGGTLEIKSNWRKD
jgi:hypothetical protein